MARGRVYKYADFRNLCVKTLNAIKYTEANTMDTLSLINNRAVNIMCTVNCLKAIVTALSGLAPTEVSLRNNIIDKGFIKELSSTRKFRDLLLLRNGIAHCSNDSNIILNKTSKEMIDIWDLLKFAIELCDASLLPTNTDGAKIAYVDLDSDTACSTFILVQTGSIPEIVPSYKRIVLNEFDKRVNVVVGKAYPKLLAKEVGNSRTDKIKGFVVREGKSIIDGQETAVTVVDSNKDNEAMKVLVNFVKTKVGPKTWEAEKGNTELERAVSLAKLFSE